MVKNKKLTHSDDEVKRYLGALTEHYTDGQKAIGEQYIGLIEHLDKRFNQVDQKLNSHTEMIGKIMIQLEEVKGELKQKVSYRDFTKLETRVAHLEVRAAGRR